MVEVTNSASITSKRASRMLTGLRSVRSEGCKVELVDDRWYTDWQMSLAGYIYGYRPAWWLAALRAAVEDGPASSIAHRDELVVAEILAGYYSDIEAVRFMLNGSDGCAAAVKLARAVTGRDKILVCGYHGFASCYASPPTDFDADDNRRGTLQAERDAFVPLGWLGMGTDWHKIDANEIAAVVVECPPVDGGREASSHWLQKLARETQEAGALFVLDEVVTAFRYGPGGAAEYYDIQGLPDLYCLGKTLGNGYPISCLAGRQEVMQELAGEPGKGLVHFSATFFGEPLGLAAATGMLRRLREEPPWAHLYNIGTYLKEEWNALGLPWRMVGHPTRPVLEPGGLTPELNSLRRHLLAQGHIFVDHPLYVTTAHTERDIESLLEAARSWKR